MVDAEAIIGRLRGSRLGVQVRALGSVTSTNDIAWAWAEAGCPEGTVVLAEEQVRGRGRFGRTWHCPRGGGLLMSVVLRPPGEAVGPAHLTGVGALGVAEAVEELAALPCAIRWPNDVTVRGLKLAGVLVERRGTDDSAPCVMGLGLNVNVAREELPEDIRGRATSLAAETGRAFAIEDVAVAVLRRLDARYSDAADGRWPQVAAAWRQRNALAGELVEVKAAGQVLHGRVVDADPLAGLDLELPGGERQVCLPDSATLLLPPATQKAPGF